MPIVSIYLVEGRTIEQKRELVKEITESIVRIMKTTPDHVSVFFVEGPRENFSRAGVLLPDQK